MWNECAFNRSCCVATRSGLVCHSSAEPLKTSSALLSFLQPRPQRTAFVTQSLAFNLSTCGTLLTLDGTVCTRADHTGSRLTAVEKTPPVFLESCWIKDDVWGRSIIAPPTQSSLMHQRTQCYKYGLCLLEKRAAVRSKLPLRPTCTTFSLSTRPPVFWEQKHDLWMFVRNQLLKQDADQRSTAFQKALNLLQILTRKLASSDHMKTCDSEKPSVRRLSQFPL